MMQKQMFDFNYSNFITQKALHFQVTFHTLCSLNWVKAFLHFLLPSRELQIDFFYMQIFRCRVHLHQHHLRHLVRAVSKTTLKLYLVQNVQSNSHGIGMES